MAETLIPLEEREEERRAMTERQRAAFGANAAEAIAALVTAEGPEE